jgi:MFS family permease
MLIPKIEKITRDATISHFFLMFGYKLFSLYFPLFLVARGFSLPEVGYTYLLIYLPIALSAPFVGFLNHKINPAILASIGILGYGLYSLGMILIRNEALFYFWQVLLGISAALFFVSARAILISSKLENYDQAFGWFYTAPFYADALAPCVGALFIWKFNFVGVFIFSLILQIFTAIFCFTQLNPVRNNISNGVKKQKINPLDKEFSFQKFQENYQKVLPKITGRDALPSILISFSVLLLAGFYFAFFVLFLKDSLSWSQNLILVFISVSSFLFLPISIFLINQLGKWESQKSIFQGGLISGAFSILFGALIPALNFLITLLITLGRSAGSLICNSGRSGLLSQKLKENPEEAGAIDTIFSPLGIALGALISGAIIGFLGYQLLFILGGVFVILVGLIMRKLAKF